MPQTLLDRLKDADKLPTAPGVALRIVELNRQDDVDIDELSRLLSQDPALAAKVIKTANSSMFGIPREVTSLRQAVLVLGLRTVNLLALSFSVISTASGRAGPAFSYTSFWTRTACCAMGMRILAERSFPKLRDEAFLTGLLANFGQLLLAECAPDEYGPVLERWSRQGGPVQAVERELLGTTYAEVGGRLLDSWGLPRDLCLAIQWHLDPSKETEEQGNALRLAQMAHFASACADILSGAELDSAVAHLQGCGSEHLGFDRTACSEVLTKIQEAIPVIAETLGLDIQDEASVLDIRQRATELLLRESLALQRQVDSVRSEKGHLEQRQSDLERRATTDALTGLRNRGFFDERLGEHLQAKDERSLGLLLIDLDHFKSVNDDHGHTVGDELLRRAASALRGAVRPVDECCRYGGEEFAVICPGISEDELRARAEQIREAIGACEVSAGNTTLRRTASVGGCLVPRGAARPRASVLIEAADRALYGAKNAGRNASEVRSLA